MLETKPYVAEAMQARHTPVLLKESIDALNLAEGKVFVDATFGAGGHTREVLKQFGEKVQLIGLDQNPSVRDMSPEFEIHSENFRQLDQVLGERKVDAILFDLGISSDQLETSGKGFSFLRDEPLDMRMSGKGPTAAAILNSWDESAIELILRGFGEESFSRVIAREIVRRRAIKKFETTFDLVGAVDMVKRGGKRIHPATKTFQAVRIATNDELAALEEGLKKGFEALKPKGRLVVISFHSLEDRIVKTYFRDLSREGKAQIYTKKPVVPTESEIRVNPRSRSAKLRVIEKL